MPSVCRAILKRLRTPGVAAALAAVLLLDWLLLPRASVAGRPRYDLGILAARQGGSGFSDFWRVRREVDGLRLEYVQDAGVGPGALAVVFLSRHASGFWASTRLTRRVHFELHPDGDVGIGDRDAVRLLVAEDFARLHPGWADEPDMLRDGIRQMTTVRWPGLVHNALSATAAGALLISVASAPSWIAPAQRRHRLRRGLCPRCCYDLTGLAEPRCPECGHARDGARGGATGDRCARR